MTSMDLDQHTRAALNAARDLAAAGIPVFVAAPDPSTTTGFRLPNAWQQTAPDAAVVDRWEPGMALCAVMGHGLDLLDVDPRNGGDPDALDGPAPISYGVAATPSGGLHSFIASLGVGSLDGVALGLDVKGGLVDGSSRGFAFLPPTVKPSKVTGEPEPYTWITPPDVERIAHARLEPDTSGAALAVKITALRGTGSVARTTNAPEWYREFLDNREPQSAVAAARAIEGKLADVTDWTPASPADFRRTLMRAAMTLGGYVGGGWLDEGDAWRRLETACAGVWGAADEDDRRWIQQGLTDGASSPFHVYTPEDEQRFGEAAGIARPNPRSNRDRSIYRALGIEAFDPMYATSDQELAEAVLMRAAPGIRYAADARVWLLNDGRDAWTERKDLARYAVKQVARLMPPGQTPIPKDTAERSEQHWQAVRRAQLMKSSGAAAVAAEMHAVVAGGDHPASLEVADLDTQPEVLWAGGYPFDLRASLEVPTLAVIDPATPHLHTAAVAPDHQVETPAWDAFLAAVIPDEELRTWALRVLSVTLAGYPDAALPIFYGRARSGKTSLVELVMRALGTYGNAANPKILSGGDNSHDVIIHDLKGLRLAFVDEGPRRGHLALEKLKQLTGGGRLTGAKKNQDPIFFQPTHTLVMTTNDEPPITDPALRARVRLIPCDEPEAKVRPARMAIERAWHDEAPGVLAALMRETAAWLHEPDSARVSAAPAMVHTMLGELVATQDPVREWVEMCTVPAKREMGHGTAAKAGYKAFLAWWQGQPEYRKLTPPSLTSWGTSLTEQGYPWHWDSPSKNFKMRPLSVMGGGPENPLWAPPNPGSSAPGPTAGPDGSGQPTDSSGGPLSGTGFPSSTGLFSSSTDSPDSYLRQGDLKNTDTPICSSAKTSQPANRDWGPECPDLVGKNGTSPAETGSGRLSGQPSGTGPGTDDLSGVPAAQARTAATTASSPTVSNTRPEVLDVLPRLEHPAAPADTDPAVAKKAETARLNQVIAQLHQQTGVPKTDLRREIKTARKELAAQAALRAASGPQYDLPVVVDRSGLIVSVDPDTAAQIVRARIAASGALTVDVEHTGYPVGHELYALRSVQLGDAMACVVLHPTEHRDLIRALLAETEASVLHAHSATADLVPTAVADLLPGGYEAAWDRMWDTTIPARLADPASTGSDPGLKKLSGAVLGDHAVSPGADDAREALFSAGGWTKKIDTHTPIERSGWAQVDTRCATMIRYAASDVLDTGALARALPTPDARVADRERLAQRMTARVTYRGVRLDRAHIGRLTEQHTAARDDAGARARAFGIENPGSDAQVGAKAAELGATLPLTKTGKPSVAAGVLEPLRDAQGPLGTFVSAVLDHRHHDTALGLFLAPYADLCDRGDGRARPTIYTLGTNTGRMSAVRPNLQQLSREGGIRACITADPGQTIISADFSGVELRVAAALSGDPNLRQIITEEDAGRGDGLHWLIARQIWGPNATKANRYVAKRIVFGRVYGGGVKNLSAQVGVSVEVGQAVLDTLDAITPTLKAWSRSVSNAAERGQTRFPAYSGRTIHLPGQTPHAAPNYAIQGSARELLVDALERWAGTRWGDCTLIPVHDELLAFVPAEDGQAATAELQRAMAGELHGIPIVSEADAPSFAWTDST